MSGCLFDLESEDQLLGGLLDGGDILAASEIVQPAEFYKEQNRYVFDAALRVLNANLEISPVTVAAELRRAGHTEISEAALHELRDRAATTFAVAYVVQYAGTVHEHAANRNLEGALKQALRRLNDTTLTPEEKLDATQHDVMNLATRQSAVELKDGATLAKAAAEALEQRREARASGGLLGLSWGVPDLDRMTNGLRGGRLYVIGGRPAMGKTWLGLAAAMHAAINLNKPTLFVSLEMPHEEVAERIAACTAKLNTDDLAQLNVEQARRYTAALEALETSPLYVDDAGTTPLTALSARARKLHRSAPLGLIVVDYLQLIETTDDQRSTRATDVGKLSRGLKQLARELNVPVIAVSQVSRSVEQRPNKRPMLSDLRESGGIEADADVVLFVYQDAYYNPKTERPNVTELIVAKHRQGAVGTAEVYFDQATGYFGQLDRHHETSRG